MHLFRKLANQIPLSLYLLARYGELAKESPDASAVSILQQAYLESCGEELSEEDAVTCCLRLEDHGQKAMEAAEAAAAKPQRQQTQGKPRPFQAKSFSDYFNHHLNSLDTTQTLLWLTEFDEREAWRLYMEADYEVVEHMLDTKKGLEQERNRLLYEGPLFGFGGKYGNSSGRPDRDEGDVRVHDISEMTPEQALARITAAQKR